MLGAVDSGVDDLSQEGSEDKLEYKTHKDAVLHEKSKHPPLTY
jgi:hypothetical protein